MWIKRLLLLLFFLSLFSQSVFSDFNLQDQIIERLSNDITIVLDELKLLKQQRQDYRKQITDLSMNSDSNVLLALDLKNQVKSLKALVFDLNGIIDDKEISLSKLQAEILVLTIQLPELKTDLKEAMIISKDLNLSRNKYRIAFYIISGVAVIELIVIIANSLKD